MRTSDDWSPRRPTPSLAVVRGQGQRGRSGVLYDALSDPDAGGTLLRAVASQTTFDQGTGELTGRRTTTLGTKKELAELTASPLRAEQSNTSIVYGDRYLMKVLRKLEPDVNPDVEISEALRERFEHSPELVGTLDYRPDENGTVRTLAILQRYVPNEGDAWSYTLDELGRFSERVLTEPPESGRAIPAAMPDALTLAADEIPEQVYEVVGPYLAVASLLGRRTGELHAVLAGVSDRKGFAPEEFTSLYQRSLYQSMRNTLRRGLQAARKGAKAVDDLDTREAILTLAGREDEILSRLKTLSETRIEALRIRTHGDYHLGQVLWTGRDVVLIDFEGEPARPIGERKLKRSPLRDVAGMLRSFHYATESTLVDQIQRGAVTAGSDAHTELASWLRYWNRWVSAAFLRSYLEVAREAEVVPADAEHTAILLDAFLLEKALYELGYEMNNRPEWVGIPLAGIAEVLGDR